MIFRQLLLAVLCLCTTSLFATEKIKIVTTIPDLAWAASYIGGERVQTKALLKGTENPHYVDAVPEFTRLVAAADIVCIVGLDLEVGYMPAVLSRSGNAKVQPGGSGYCETGQSVTVVDKPSGPVDRSMGDIHPHGNPHFYLSPKSLAEGARVIADTLAAVDAANASIYLKNLQTFQKNMDDLHQEILGKLQPVLKIQKETKGALLMEYHREFTYFFHHYGLHSFGSVEEKPGVAPGAGRLATLAASARSNGIRAVLAADYNPESVLNKFSKLSGVKILIVPTMIQNTRTIRDYTALQHHIADAVLMSITERNPAQL